MSKVQRRYTSRRKILVHRAERPAVSTLRLRWLGTLLAYLKPPTDELELKSITAVGGFNLNPVYYDNDGEAALRQMNAL